ncbi:MAG: hypothetical protein V1810_01930 [Candidatus Beckwithbacteria bacterium]
MIQIKANNQLIALIIRANHQAKPNQFLTSKTNPLQLGVLKFPKNHQVKPHQHRHLAKTTHQNQEFIYLVSGQAEVEFFYKGSTLVKHRLNPGDCLLQLKGGHGFTFLKPSKIITIKQGPYRGLKAEKEFLQTG